MIPYSLIIPSASRPHLLKQVLESLFVHVDQLPVRVAIHNDEVFRNKRAAIEDCLQVIPEQIPIFYANHERPIGHGASLHWLLEAVQTPYVLYSQDDHVVERKLPIQACLQVMDTYHLHHVRFNKRATMDHKEKPDGTRWYKKELEFDEHTLTVSDHWYFQTALNRRKPLWDVVNWFMNHPFEWKWFHERCEDKINRAFDGFHEDFPQALNNFVDPKEAHLPDVRARLIRTFIWGKIGEERYIRHIGADPKDHALVHPRLG